MARWCAAIAAGRSIRVACFMTTVLPNPRPGCYSRRFPPPPDSAWESLKIGFTTLRGMGGCNDLIFRCGRLAGCGAGPVIQRERAPRRSLLPWVERTRPDVLMNASLHTRFGASALLPRSPTSPLATLTPCSGHGAFWTLTPLLLSSYYPRHRWVVALVWTALVQTSVRDFLEHMHYSIDMLLAVVVTSAVWGWSRFVYPESSPLPKRPPGAPPDASSPFVLGVVVFGLLTAAVVAFVAKA
jgi:hypothetical protein